MQQNRFLHFFFKKVNSVKEACPKCFTVHLLKFETLQTTWKNKTKNIKMLNLLVKNWKLFPLFHVICNISNFNMWTANHLAHASCTELTLQRPISFYYIKAFNLVTVFAGRAKVSLNRDCTVPIIRSTFKFATWKNVSLLSKSKPKTP